MVSSWSSHLQRAETPAETRFYSHLLEQARTLHPREAIAAFQDLLEGSGSSCDSDVRAAFHTILQYGFIAQDFRFILNRSCYIYINTWFQTPGHRFYIPEFIEIFEALPSTAAQTPLERHLRGLLSQFVTTPQYTALRCLAIAIRTDWEVHQAEVDTRPLEGIIKRYPYVYRHKLLTKDSSLDQRRIIRTMQREAQQKFDVELSCYSTYVKFNNVIPFKSPAKNPTLLHPSKLNHASHQFSGKVDGFNTHRDLAQQFLTYSQWTRSYRELKRDLYEYLAPAIHSKFGKHHFNQRLETCLSGTLEYYDYEVPTDALLAETCKKLLNFLTVESPHRPEHSNFIDLLANLGATLTIALLLKIVLLCHQAKPWLERRLAILFHHYSSRPQHDVAWLVEALENTNVALSTNFSPVLV
ncbi:MAG: hypothetical protein VKL39_03280 [Leptolyngbyaceae bacterium]|nr:hypothetical protein [Leptolyngbyaceae bacterium]